MAWCSEESRFLEDLKRKRVKVRLSDTQISGVIQRVTHRRSVLLEDVSEVKSGRKFPGVKIIFGHEILKVEFSGSANQDSLVDEEHRSEDSFRKKTAADEDEDSVSYVLIDELHEKFGPAVMHIQQQKVVAIGAEVFGQIAQERLCWLQVATKRVVYLFDLLLLGAQAFKNGLSMILENPHILKVVHDGRCVSRCLRAEFRVHLTNVFDTQECPEVWYVRPAPPALMNIMAASVSHLLPLRLVLLDALMSDFTILVDAYMSSCHHQSLQTEQGEGALPAVVEELLAVRQERMDWAARRYSLTDAGLLRRSSFTHTEVTLKKPDKPV
ncbi:piRNA biogenesis protein EXD1 isoform X2 [Puntigrus tetrazona]|uniref:piRNA biogenesis protein EXD1 isoform X2 n=1 Tax=Puntigrus tetrazona TaxID=1606681 RepID=UPI001C88FD8C|nr:piRNA biogenesis protein EXD1 isoform X2 [Puntigrus tetrazona]